MNYRVVLSFLLSFVCVQLFASEASKPNPLFRYTQRCIVNYSLSGFWTIESVTCKQAIENIEKIQLQDKCDKERVKRLQVCFVGNNGVKQCAVSKSNMSCEQAIEEIEKAQAVSKKD